MIEKRVWIIEEAEDMLGYVGQTQTMGMIEVDEQGWRWQMPATLTVEQQAEWNRVLTVLKNVNGEDLRHLVCFEGLLRHVQGTSDRYLD